jgi:hypothetical protein
MVRRWLKYHIPTWTVTQVNRRDVSDDSGIGHQNQNSGRFTISVLSMPRAIRLDIKVTPSDYLVAVLLIS